LGGRSLASVHAAFDAQGYIIFEKVLSIPEIEAIRAALAPHMTQTGRNNFEGFQSNRVYSLLAKAPEIFSDLATHPLALSFAERDLGSSCRLSALLAINLLPGETVQGWHHDDSHIDVPLPRPPFGLSAFWAIDDTTEINGATEIIPKSHKWGAEKQSGFETAADGFDAYTQSEPTDFYPDVDHIKAAMPAGSLMLTKGTLLHRGGANRSDKPRLIVTPQYCAGWARQLENMILAVPQEIAATLPRRTRELIGYNLHAPFMGFVNGAHPDRLLD